MICIDNLNEVLDKICGENKHCYLMGDYNINLAMVIVYMLVVIILMITIMNKWACIATMNQRYVKPCRKQTDFECKLVPSLDVIFRQIDCCNYLCYKN